MRISDWSSDVCSSDLVAAGLPDALGYDRTAIETASCNATDHEWVEGAWGPWSSTCSTTAVHTRAVTCKRKFDRSEEHTSELQSLMRISYAVFCLKKKRKPHRATYIHTYTTRHTLYEPYNT